MSRSLVGEILTLAEVAEYLKISKKTAYKMARSGDLPAFKAGKHWRVLGTEFASWIDDQRVRSREQTS